MQRFKFAKVRSINHDMLNETPRKKRIRILKNDYCQHYIDTGEYPQNFVRDHDPEHRFAEYPRLARLLQLKNEVIRARAHPTQSVPADLRSFDWRKLPCKFDAIIVDPPWAEYEKRAIALPCREDLSSWTFEELAALPIPSIAESPSFCFLWAGTEHLDDARRLFAAWGFRRCEDVVWVKSNVRKAHLAREMNRRADEEELALQPLVSQDSVLVRTKEHCLVGVRGSVRRSSDTHIIHANLDTDVIVDEIPNEPGSTAKPMELYDIVERFCLGRRRLELFGRETNLRPGWLTIGKEVPHNFNAERYASWFLETPGPQATCFPFVRDHRGGVFLGTTPEIETLRPRSPPRTPRPEAVG